MARTGERHVGVADSSAVIADKFTEPYTVQTADDGKLHYQGTSSDNAE